MIDGQRSRLFFAFEVSEEVRTEAIRVQARLQTDLGSSHIRWTDPADMHITALFLGDHANERLQSFAAAATHAVADVKPFALSVHGVGRFPTAGRPRVVWVGAREPDHRPASQIIDGLRGQLPDIPTDHPSYRPHITIAYVKPNASEHTVERALDSRKHDAALSMIVDRLVLMQTIPPQEKHKSNCARYNIVQVFPFGV